MAEYLASIFGTEKDKVNCSFYFKIGACRHGERCSRLHNKPTFSQTILLQNMYQNPNNSTQNPGGLMTVSPEVEQAHYEEFFEDVFVECDDKYGPIEKMNVCDNLGDHLVGNVYIKVWAICYYINSQWRTEPFNIMPKRISSTHKVLNVTITGYYPA
jgi:splicing factor U2AF subunit